MEENKPRYQPPRQQDVSDLSANTGHLWEMPVRPFQAFEGLVAAVGSIFLASVGLFAALFLAFEVIGLWMAVFFGMYFGWAAIRFFKLAFCVRNALLHTLLTSVDPSVFLRRDEMRRWRRGVWFSPIGWAAGIPKNEAAFRLLQKDHPREALRLFYHEQWRGHWAGFAVLLPGFQFLMEKWILFRFNSNPRPLKLIPRLQPYIWGREPSQSYILKKFYPHAVETAQGLRIAELWFGAHPKNPAIVRWGTLTIPLDRFSTLAGEKLLGAGRKNINQMFKVLDAAQPLSLQMHERSSPHSKNETWMIAITDSPAQDRTIAEILIGFRPEEELPAFARGRKLPQAYFDILSQQAADSAGDRIKAFHNRIAVRWENRQLELYLNGCKQPASVKARFGLPQGRLVVNIPGATPHSLIGGTIYELQEISDKTLRLYDNGRQDPERPLHIREAIDKLDFTLRRPADFLLEPVRRDHIVETIIQTPYYAMDEMILESGAEGREATYEVVQQEGYEMLVVVEGTGIMMCENQRMTLTGGDWVLIPATPGRYALKTQQQLKILKAYEKSVFRDSATPAQSVSMPA